MSTLVIDLDTATGEALTSLASARGTTPADLAAEIVARYVSVQDLRPSAARPASDRPDASVDAEPSGRKLAPPDSIDALVGRYDAEPGDIDEIVYGR